MCQHRLGHAGDLPQPLAAIGKSPDTGQNQVTGRGDVSRVRGHRNVHIQGVFAAGALKRLRGRAQITGSIINNRDRHNSVSA